MSETVPMLMVVAVTPVSEALFPEGSQAAAPGWFPPAPGWFPPAPGVEPGAPGLTVAPGEAVPPGTAGPAPVPLYAWRATFRWFESRRAPHAALMIAITQRTAAIRTFTSLRLLSAG
jgi:hypothetical protein